MNKMFTRMALAVALIAGASTTAQAQTALAVDGSKGYDGVLVKGQDYILPGTDKSWYVMPDLFTHKEGDVWTFQGYQTPEYAYFFIADEGLKYIKTEYRPVDDSPEGTYADWAVNRALWVNGSNSIGFPSYANNPINWQGDRSLCVPQIDANIYRLTLTFGQELNSEAQVNFKFFKGTNWGGDVLPGKEEGNIWMEDNPWLHVGGQDGASGDNGNLYSNDGVAFGVGDKLIVTIDMNVTPGKLTVDYQEYIPSDFPTFNGENMAKKGNFYVAEATLTQGGTFTLGNEGVVGMDLSTAFVDECFATTNGNGTFTFNAISGPYTIMLMPSLNYVKIFPGTYDAPATFNDAKALWLIGSNTVGMPTYAANSSNWSAQLSGSIPVAQIAENIYKIKFTVGQQLGTGVNFKFFGQYGWGTEFHGSDLVFDNSDFIYINNPEGEWTYDADGNEVYTRGSDDGNIKGSLREGETLTLTIDLNGLVFGDPVNDVEAVPGKVTVQYSGAGLQKPTFNGEELTAVGNSYERNGILEQGKSYRVENGPDADIVNSASFYYNPDYFVKNADGSFTFKALTGNYHLGINMSGKYFHIYPLTADGAAATYENGGAMYANGGNQFGKPSYAINPNGWGESNNWNPTLSQSVSLAQVKDYIYTLTLTIGKQLGSGVGGGQSFKFYGEGQGWGGEVQDYIVKAGEGDQYFVRNEGASDTNNVFQVEPLTDGDTFVIVFDRTGETPVLSAQKALDETGAGVGVGIAAIQSVAPKADDAVYNLNGIRVSHLQKGIYVRSGKKMVK